MRKGILLVMLAVLGGCTAHEFTPEEKAAFLQTGIALIKAGQPHPIAATAYQGEVAPPRTCAVTSFRNAMPC